MTARRIDTEGEAHRVPGSVCYDCLQTRRDQIRFVADRDKKMEAAFGPGRPRRSDPRSGPDAQALSLLAF